MRPDAKRFGRPPAHALRRPWRRAFVAGGLVAGLLAGFALWYHTRAQQVVPSLVLKGAGSVPPAPGGRAETNGLRGPHVASRLPSDPETAPPNSPASATEDELLAKILVALAPEGGEERDHALNELLPALADKNPSVAARFAEANDNPGSREEVIRLVARAWAGKDAESALTWADSRFSGEERLAALEEVCKQRVCIQPGDTVRLREQLTASDESFAAVADLAATWAERDPREALKWIDAHPPDPRMDEVVQRVVFEYAQTQPENAARYVVQSLKPGAAQSEAAITALHQWALRDLAAAARWAESFPEGELRDRALLELGGLAVDFRERRAD